VAAGRIRAHWPRLLCLLRFSSTCKWRHDGSCFKIYIYKRQALRRKLGGHSSGAAAVPKRRARCCRLWLRRRRRRRSLGRRLLLRLLLALAACCHCCAAGAARHQMPRCSGLGRWRAAVGCYRRCGGCCCRRRLRGGCWQGGFHASGQPRLRALLLLRSACLLCQAVQRNLLQQDSREPANCCQEAGAGRCCSC
jgi:hypothetical protein